jgi:hypothetical protein
MRARRNPGATFASIFIKSNGGRLVALTAKSMEAKRISSEKGEL